LTETTKELKYAVKLINEKNKKDCQTVDLHGVTKVFSTTLELKCQLIESLDKLVPPASKIDSFQVGYLYGRPQKKRSIISTEDLEAMYTSAKPNGEILLWCTKRDTDESDSCKTGSSSSRKRSTNSSSDGPQTKKASYESTLEELTDELKQIHGDKYNYAQLKMWARMIGSQQWKSKDNPPPIPMICGSHSKEKRKDDTSGALTEAAVAFAHALRGSPVAAVKTPPSTGISPGKKAQLSQQYLQQLTTIRNLHDDGILTDEEFGDEKRRIMTNLRSLK